MTTGLRLLLVVALLVVSALAGAPVVSAQGAAGSAVTVSGKGDFANLKVTVGQTADLIGQVVKVSWTGGDQTPGAEFQNSFLQIMQCWGDEPGPSPTQCQYGVTNRGQFNLGKRQLQQFRVDPKEPTFDALEIKNSLDFWPAGRAQPTSLVDGGIPNPFLDAQITNEVPFARSRSDGAGEVFFEVQTFRQSAGLDCGKSVTIDGAVRGKPCWLVIVPRNKKEVDGLPAERLESSPLSQTNWEQRIQIRLDFQPVEQSCRIGAAERPVRGHESVVEAISRWQPTLCANGGSIFSYTQFTDDLGRNDLLTGTPGVLDVITNPVPPDSVLPNRPVVYAPIAISGLAIAFNVDRQAARTLVDPLNGARFEELNLTPRLVAKLLSQSYRNATSGAGDPAQSTFLEKNPSSLTRDLEFLKYNPLYKDRDSTNRPVEALVQIGTADVTAQLWSWVLGDADAKAFLAGTPDENGMIVNPANQGLAEPVSNFPRDDQSCFPLIIENVSTKLCTSDERQYANDMHQAARAGGRGDTLGRTIDGYDPVLKRVKVKAAERQSPGQTGLLAVTDTASAARYGLQTARLAKASPEPNPVRDVARDFVAPTPEGLLGGLAAMKPGPVAGTLQADPLTTAVGAYPLTSLSYAATAPSAITKEAGADYSAFLEYAVGPGQAPGLAPGTLPSGYVPLPDALRVQTRAAAAAIKAQAGVPIAVDTNGQGDNASTGAVNNGTTGGGVSTSAGGGPTVQGATGLSPAAAAGARAVPAIGNVAATLPISPTGPLAAAPASPGAVQPVAATRLTPGLPAPAGVGALLVALLVCGGLAAVLAPVTHMYAARRSGAKPIAPPWKLPGWFARGARNA